MRGMPSTGSMIRINCVGREARPNCKNRGARSVTRKAPVAVRNVGSEDIGMRKVSLRPGFAIPRADAEAPAVLLVQESRIHRLGIKPWQTAPYDLSTVVDQRRKWAVPNDSEVFESHVSID